MRVWGLLCHSPLEMLMKLREGVAMAFSHTAYGSTHVSIGVSGSDALANLPGHQNVGQKLGGWD